MSDAGKVKRVRRRIAKEATKAEADRDRLFEQINTEKDAAIVSTALNVVQESPSYQRGATVNKAMKLGPQTRHGRARRWFDKCEELAEGRSFATNNAKYHWLAARLLELDYKAPVSTIKGWYGRYGAKKAD